MIEQGSRLRQVIRVEQKQSQDAGGHSMDVAIKENLVWSRVKKKLRY